MTALLVAALALAAPDYDLSWKGGMSCADGTCTIPGDDLAFDCNTCPCLIYQESETTDSAGCGMTMHAGHAYGTSRDGGDLILSGGDGSHSIAVTASISAGDSVTASVDGTTLPTLVADTDFVCSSVTDDQCAENLCAALNAQSGVRCSGTTTPIHPQVDDANSIVTFAIADGGVDGVFAVDTAGGAGVVNILGEYGFVGPTLQLSADAGKSGISSTANGSYLYFWVSNTIPLYFSSTLIRIQNSDLRFETTGARIYNNVEPMSVGANLTTSHSLGTNDFGTGGSLEVDGILYADGGFVSAPLESDLTAGACTAGTWVVDNGGATRELCRCNDAGTAYDCISVTTTNGPTD